MAAWLDEHHRKSSGIWLKIAKKGSGEKSVSYAEAIDVAICYGWIDGQKRALDDDHWLQRFTVRSPRSKWSKVNRDKAEAFIAAGEMTPAGLEQVDLAKADGRWEAAYEGMKTAGVPPDFDAAMKAVPKAESFFETLDRHNRFAMIYRVQDAKRPETRQRRIEQYVQMLSEGRKLHP
jgi:uncharacterized protein YdeI (YjbR/CyaY-like superfamily)